MAGPFCIALTGPTAVGKTASLLALRDAFDCPIEVVSVDAFQVYRGLDIGTAKPDAALRAAIPHHLIDLIDIDRQFTLMDFVAAADRAAAEIAARGALPVLCGGTVYYLKHWLFGMPRTPASDPALRAELAADLAARGPAALHAELATVDPEAAGRIHPRDAYRVCRALEVWRASGRPLSSFEREGATPARPALAIALSAPRDELNRRIDRRVDEMFERGLAGEAAALAAAGRRAEDPGMKAIGYAEFFELARAGGTGIAEVDADAARGLVALRTRQYAKRQMNFLRHLPGLRWVEAARFAESLPEIRRWAEQSRPDRLT